MLSDVSGVIDKAATQAAAKEFDEVVMLGDRLYPDMFTLARQIRQATDFARNAPRRLAGVALPGFRDGVHASATRWNRGQKNLPDHRTAADVVQGRA